MTESEFLDLAEETMDAIEAALERATDAGEVDVECSRSGNVLDVEFVENGSKIIVNSQAPMQEMWLAARVGGVHYRRENNRWINTRDGSELYAALSGIISDQTGVSVTLSEA